ncbi:succinate dehydrogenase/fumarate reductase iron-sulfur subunit [Methanolobus profundi]|uniref:succinate dehydrogenase n=1 Tax=Methanolobus profundi TaxID=487685 RepID=A0A1I4RT43_9EURY|nr:succinate dehydrogenase/fumarate reductase iron-sulfur subunit [Methanolobus profundi]SFM55452.1 succinate dehydrogenase / fumarate reductase iron-sulfur subunit [Methanolobus profundi]
MVKLTIRRQDGNTIWYETFEVEERPGMTVLEALFQIQEKQDGSLCFRYSCRGAVCGSCAMLINRKPGLACRTQLSDARTEVVHDPESENVSLKHDSKDEDKEGILVEPLPNLQVIRDLIVDMDHFFRLVDSIGPWLGVPEDAGNEQTLMEPALQMQIEKYTNCILCATCHGSCPAAERDGEYLGPAALAKAWRFFIDPRNDEEDVGKLLSDIDSHEGVWGCDVVYRCVAVCPKKVPPTTAIIKLREKIKER